MYALTQLLIKTIGVMTQAYYQHNYQRFFLKYNSLKIIRKT